MFVFLACDLGESSNKKLNPLTQATVPVSTALGSQTGSSFADAITVTVNRRQADTTFNLTTLVKDEEGPLIYFSVAQNGHETPITKPSAYREDTADGYVIVVKALGNSDYRKGGLYFRVTFVVPFFGLRTNPESPFSIDTSSNAVNNARDGSSVAQAAVINNDTTALVGGELVDLSKFITSSTGAKYDVLKADGTPLDSPVTGVAIATSHTIVGNAELVF